MALMAASLQQGLTTYAATKWVENFDSAVSKVFDFDPANLMHTVLHALLLTFIVVILSRVIDNFVRPDTYYRKRHFE